jgi:hypothetical protein
MSRLHLPTIYDYLTINNKKEGYARVSSSLTTGVCGDVRVFWKHRHIVISACNPRNVSEISNDDQCMTVGPETLSGSSFGHRARGIR